jgi:glyoxylase-like metal-dependent hydrolase (beta-lactamase superfamily II)
MNPDRPSTSRRRALALASISATLLPGCQFLLTRFVELPAPPPPAAAAPPPPPPPPPAVAAAPPPPPAPAPAPVRPTPQLSTQLLAHDGTPSTYAFDSGAQMWVLQRGPLKFHHYVTPEPGGRASAVVVEFADRLWVVDTLGAPDYGRELRFYANTLNKPIARVIFTHEHPDTWSGWGAFSEFPTFAPRETEAFLQNVMPTMPRREGVPAPKLVGVVAAGEERVGNVRVQIRIARDAESAAIVMLGFPEQTTWIASDMVYQKRHAYLGNRQMGRWSEQLNQLPEWVKSNALVLPGHGAPADGRSIGEMRRYLLAAQEAMARLKVPAEIERSLLSQFPDHGGQDLLRVGIAHAQQRR